MVSRSEVSIAPPSPESSLNRVRIVVDKVESVLHKDGERVPGRRFGLCGYASNLVRYVAEREGIYSDIHQVKNIHKKFGGLEDDAFQHGFNVLKIQEGYFLVDETFGQFINPDSLEIRQGIGSVSGHALEHPIHVPLLEDGFVPLTDDTLRKYMRATTTANDRSYIDQINVEDITSDDTLPLDWDYTVEELKSYLDGSATESSRVQAKFKSLLRRVQRHFVQF